MLWFDFTAFYRSLNLYHEISLAWVFDNYFLEKEGVVFNDLQLTLTSDFFSFLSFFFRIKQTKQQQPASCWHDHGVCYVLVYGLPQHQAVISVVIVWEMGNSSVSEVIAGLERAVGQQFVLPLSQNQQAITTCWHNLHTNITITTSNISVIRLLNTASEFVFISSL